MQNMYLWTLGGIALISLISLVGVFTLSWKEEVVKKYLLLFVSIATGALLGDAFIHLIPESLESSPSVTLTSLFIIAGIVVFFVLEKFFHWHHHCRDEEKPGIHPVGKLILFSDVVHNFMDGVIIAASFTISFPVGVATTLAVMLHEIPQELGDFAVLLHAGFSRKKALVANFLTALSAFAGAGFFFLIGHYTDLVAIYFLPLIAGGFIYIALADLIPELHKTKKPIQSAYQLIALLVGVATMYLLVFVE